MINDEYGDQHISEDDVLASYTRWLHYMANQLLDPWDERHDDLVQEGRIAMWRALATHDPEKGALPSWLTVAAKLRMKDVAYGSGQPTGREATRGRREVDARFSVEAMQEDGLEEMLGVSDDLAGVEMAYHHGEISEALDLLSPSQRKYVIARFWGGLDPSSKEPAMRELVDLVPELRKRHLWNGSSKQRGAKERLVEALKELAVEYA